MNALGVELFDEFHVSDQDPNYVYRWTNQKDSIVSMRLRQGYELVKGDDPDIPEEIRKLQSTGNPGGGQLRQRGDVLLMRIKKDVYETRVKARNDAARERQQASVDDMVSRANDETRKMLRRYYAPQQIPKSMVYDEGNADPKPSGPKE